MLDQRDGMKPIVCKHGQHVHGKIRKSTIVSIIDVPHLIFYVINDVISLIVHLIFFYVYVAHIFSWKTWRINIEGTFPKALEERGLMDKDVLPVFPYRDDGLLVYEVIKTYASKIVKHYYGRIITVTLYVDR